MASHTFLQLKILKLQHDMPIIIFVSFWLCFLLVDRCCCALTCSPIQTSNCKCQFDNDAKTVIDFSPIGNKDGKPQFPFDYYGLQRAWKYAFNPCFPFSGSSPCTNMAVCQENDDASQIFALGEPKPTKWTTNDNGIVISYSKADGGVTRTSDVTFTCDKTALTTPSLQFKGEDQGPLYLFTVNTCLACVEPVTGCPYPTQGSAGLTPGGIVCIIFTVLVVVYLVGGILFQKFARGATGKEMIPNYEFWSDFPALVKDGVVYIPSLCKKDGYSSI